MQRLLITGGMGLLGIGWAMTVRHRLSVFLGTHRRTHRLPDCEAVALEIDDAAKLEQTVTDLKPDFIVHAVGLSSVDRCEEEPALARETNVVLAANMAAVARKRGIPLAHISTDHFFDSPGRAAKEEDPPVLLNEYARTKYEGEVQVQRINPDALIVRTNFFGWGPPWRSSLSDWVLSKLRNGEKIQAFADVYFTPILIENLALAVQDLLERGEHGIVNVAGDEVISKFTFARTIAEVFGLPAEQIEQISVESAQLKARRPRNLALNSERVRKILNRSLGDAVSSIERLRAQESEFKQWFNEAGDNRN